MMQSKNIIDKIYKKGLILTLLFGYTLQIEATATNFQLSQICVTQDIDNCLLYMITSPFWSHLIDACVLLVILILFVRICLFEQKKKKLNNLIIDYIKTVQDFQKTLKLIKGPLDEIGMDENLNEAQKDKINLAIWSTDNLQGKITFLIEQEKSDHFFRFILDHISEKKHPLKSTIESNTKTSKLLNDSSVTSEYDSLPGKETMHNQIFMEKLINILKNNIEDNKFTIETLSQRIGMSRSSLYHKIKDITGLTPVDFIRLYRLEKAKNLLKTHQYSISEVAYKTGFSDVRYFRIVFKRVFDITPGNYSKEE